MKDQYKDLLRRPVEAIIHLSDVFSAPQKDFDAELTVTFRNLGTLSDRCYFVGGNAYLAGYGGVLINDLVLERRKVVVSIPELSAEPEKAVAVVLNSLPREGYETQTSPNGRDFHLAMTESGAEIFACPLTTLSALESRNAILALYRIPNKDIPFTNGDREQFRSSIIALSRYKTECMETIFEYESTEALVLAKKQGTHPNVIPEQQNDLEFAYADRFGNVRLSVRNAQMFRENLEASFGKKVSVSFGDSDSVSAVYVESLADIPVGSLGLYANVADITLPHREAGYVELVKRSDHCLTETETALDVLKKQNDPLWGIPIQINIP